MPKGVLVFEKSAADVTKIRQQRPKMSAARHMGAIFLRVSPSPEALSGCSAIDFKCFSDLKIASRYDLKFSADLHSIK